MQPIGAERYLEERMRRQAALVTVDVQASFFADDEALARMGRETAPMRAVLPKIAELHDRCRRGDIGLVHVRSVAAPWLNWPRHVAPPTALERLRKAPPGTTMVERGTPGFDFAPEAMPAEGEPVVTKHVHDAFLGTPLDFTLRRLGVETVVLAGLTTESCVETTARSALGRGYAVIVAEDAVATYDGDLHRASLRALAEVVGIVATAEEIFAARD